MMRLMVMATLCLTLVLSCKNPQKADQTQGIEPQPKRMMLSLGDSYTIGQSVAEADRWPNQLARALQEDGIPVEPPRIIARTGWTTTELLTAIRSSQLDSMYDLVTLLIGVNDQFRGLGIDYYRTGFMKLLDQAIALSGNDPQRVVVLSIPDYSVTPFAQNSDTSAIRRELEQFNSLNQSLSLQAGVYYVNITPISKKARLDRSYLANDNLHPSGKMYQEWAVSVLPIARVILEKARP